MKRGRLRVLLGAAPGVGKTYEMLEEGRRLRDSGRDVVIGARGDPRPRGDRRAGRGLPDRPPPRSSPTAASSSPRWTSMPCWSGIPNSPSSTNSRTPTRPGRAIAKRWQDVQELLDAGIDVITTVNIQHIESLNDVVEQITGVVAARDGAGRRRPRGGPDRGRRPRAAVAARSARRRESSTPPSGSMRRSRTTSASATSPRCGNSRCCGWPTRSTALCKLYRAEHGIEGTWQARERVVVALTGGPGG